MIKNLADVKISAEDLAWKKGHLLGSWFRQEHLGVNGATSDCVYCGAHALACLLPNRPDVSLIDGAAFERKCSPEAA